jgi:acetylornithine deacetylase/succinyl-diaminopimelate desuccinylase-like protein
LPRLFERIGVRPATDIVLALTVGEEGLGNLRGMRAVVDAHPSIGAAVAVEGHNLGRVTHVAVGSRRLRVRVEGPGGHSWGDFGQPSAIHTLARIVAELDAIPTTSSPKTTLNVGLIEGGVSVNTIAPSASFVLDMRSTDEGSLRRLSDKVARVVHAFNRGGVRTSIEVLGERPAGVVPLGSRIVQVATSALSALGVNAICDASSTDANIPISRGVPAVCLGLTAGGNVHRIDEYIDIGQVPQGMAQLAVVALALAEEIAAARVGPGLP